ncbi:ankyrin repeat domain-containing protein [Sphingomonas psychrotolerans]|uniref:Uncharacterized protein n=1 Tax=Sphingomonas psychrotolerans TaxID=1327635 RepID=A0A2K8MM19_9SPHN|nr:ankyrin repeat domain-containing protein [Sphingomonas psychrotolerans]ATY34875.1 hypothetical protein CVN68_22440 [Sphingomonas psychrotolerans]
MSLDEAIRAGDVAAARVALGDSTDVDRRDADGFTPLMMAAGLGQTLMVELLLTAGADLLAVEPRMGATVLHKAAQSGSPAVIRLLLDCGAFVDQQTPVLGNTPLMDAVLHKHEGAVQLLLDRGARTGIRNHWHQTALELAQEDGSEAIARAIVLHETASAEQLAGSALIVAIKEGDVGEARRLIAEGTDVNQRIPVTGTVEDDYTALGIAVRTRQVEIVHLLLDAGADPHGEIGLMRGTAIHEAAFLGYAHVLRVLLQGLDRGGVGSRGLDAQGPYNGLTALHDAVWHGHVEAAQILVEHGASLGLRTHSGQTPRELASLYGYEDLARILAKAE